MFIEIIFVYLIKTIAIVKQKWKKPQFIKNQNGKLIFDDCCLFL